MLNYLCRTSEWFVYGDIDIYAWNMFHSRLLMYKLLYK